MYFNKSVKNINVSLNVIINEYCECLKQTGLDKLTQGHAAAGRYEAN